VKTTKKLLIIFLIIVYLFLNLIVYNTYATSQVISNNIDEIDDEKYPGVKALIKQMQQEHPNWKFEILYTNLNWEDVIREESKHERNLVQSTYLSGQGFVCEVCGDKLYEGGSWKCASITAISYLMDPRYFLNENNIFQFLNIEYNDTCTIENIQKMVSGSFLDNENYINTLINAGKEYNLNPYYLVARIIQEQGTSGTTVLSSGKEYTGISGTTYSGLYNLYNIEATGNDIIENGLKKAQKEGWTTIEASIAGGAKWIKENYADYGQTTLYLQKFDVEDGSKGLYWHQYMQNLMAAQSEGTKLRSILADTNAIDNEYTFLIPVYENMPTLENMDLIKINADPSLQLREGPSKYSNRVGSGYNGNIIIRLQKAEVKDTDGYFWDLVILKNGLIGYMSREALDGSKTYLIHVKDIKMNFEENTPIEPEVPEQPENSGGTEEEQPEEDEPQNEEVVNSNKTAKINNITNIITATPTANREDVVSLIGEISSIKDKDGNVVDLFSKLATGMIINDKYTVIVLGDVSGDGEVKSLDYIMIKNAIMGNKMLTDIERIAADTSGEGNITSLDYIKVKNHIMQTKFITLY